MYFKVTKTIPQPSKLLFEMVMDVESYPLFLPWCTRIEIIPNTGYSQEQIVDLTLSFQGIKKTYRSRIKNKILSSSHRQIIISSLDPLFSFFNAQWDFEDWQNGSDTIVSFFIDLQFKSRLANFFLSQKIFGILIECIIEAFENRALNLSNQLNYSL